MLKQNDAAETPTTVDVSWVGNVLVVTWGGRVRGEEVSEALFAAKRVLGSDRVTRILVDTVGVTGYELSVRGPSVDFLQFFKLRGLAEIVAVMPNPLVSMFAGTMRLVTKVRFRIFKTRPEALHYLEEVRDKATTST
jgi:hypothetical protein